MDTWTRSPVPAGATGAPPDDVVNDPAIERIWRDEMHEDVAAVECVDPETGLAVPDGEPGELVFTNLVGATQPLLRHIGRLTRTPACACGSTRCGRGPRSRRPSVVIGRS